MTSETRRSGRHRTDLLSLIFGLLFLGGAGLWAVEYYLDLPWRFDWSLPHLGWIVAGALVLAGLLGVLASLRREAPPPMPPAPVEAAAPEDTPPPVGTDGIEAGERDRPE